MGSNGSFSTVILNKENASKIWRLIQQTGDELVGKLPNHPNHPNHHDHALYNHVHHFFFIPFIKKLSESYSILPPLIFLF